ncbi:hypothetical protein A7Q09_05360 [Methylacidiphilum sp. Yel]|nr:hypothetical protein A7Q09_05360 [Methylacidiphilum sp. Yel]
MARARGGVQNLQGEDGSLGVRGAGAFDEDWFQRRVEEALDELGRGVVAAGGLALVAGLHLEPEGGGVHVHLGVELKEGLVHTPQLLGAEVPVVHSPANPALGHLRERPHGSQQVFVRKLRAL